MRISKGPALKVLPKRTDEPARDDPRELAARLRDVGQAARAFALALDDAGLTERMRDTQVPLQNTRARRTNPKQTVTDVLFSCEALAAITGPQALITGDTVGVHDEARRLARVLRALGEVVAQIGDGILAPSAGDGESDSFSLLAILRADPVRNALARLADLLADLAAVERAQPGRDRWALRLGTRILIPLSIVLITVALILFFAGGIVFATGAVAISPQGVVFSNPIDNTTPEQADQHPTAIAAHATATPATPGATRGGKTGAGSGTGGAPGAAPTAPPAGGSPGSAAPTPTRAPPPSATPTPLPPAVSVTPTTMAACQNKSESFEISYTSGQGTLSWTATVSTGGVQISLDGTSGSWTSQVSGSLLPLTRAKVFVLSPTGASGAVTVTFSAGLPSRTVTIDNSTCTLAGAAPDTRGLGQGHTGEAEPRSTLTSGTPASSSTSSSPVQEDTSSAHT